MIDDALIWFNTQIQELIRCTTVEDGAVIVSWPHAVVPIDSRVSRSYEVIMNDKIPADIAVECVMENLDFYMSLPRDDNNSLTLTFLTAHFVAHYLIEEGLIQLEEDLHTDVIELGTLLGAAMMVRYLTRIDYLNYDCAKMIANSFSSHNIEGTVDIYTNIAITILESWIKFANITTH